MEPNNNATFIFREPKNQQELEVLLKVRYTAFMQSDWRSTVTPNPYGISIDSYDYQSRIIGLFVLENSGLQRPIGSARIVSAETGTYRTWLDTILSKYSKLTVSRSENLSFSILEYFKNNRNLLDFIDKNEKNEQEVAEIGRLSILPDMNQLKLSVVFIDALAAIFFLYHDVCIMQVKTDISKFYQSYGFAPLPNVVHEALCKPVQAHFIESKMLHLGNTTKIEKMRRAYHKTKQICFHNNQPSNFYLEKLE
jgi:predicted GNAT family N-acyltransferase